MEKFLAEHITLCFRVPVKHRAALEAWAKAEGITASELMRRILEHQLRQRRQKEMEGKNDAG